MCEYTVFYVAPPALPRARPPPRPRGPVWTPSKMSASMCELVERRDGHQQHIATLMRELASEREALKECNDILRTTCDHVWQRDWEVGGPQAQYICTRCRLVR